MRALHIVLGAAVILSVKVAAQPSQTGRPADTLPGRYSASGVIDAREYCHTPGTFDQTCLTNAIAALPGEGGTVLLGNASYTLSATVSIVNRTRVTLDGHGATVTAADGLNANLLFLDNCQRCRVIGLEVNGNGANQTGTSYGIVLQDSAYSIIEDAYVTGCLTAGVYLYYDGVGSSADEIKVLASYIQSNLGIGVLVNSVNDSLISANHIDYNGGTAGILIENAFNNVALSNNVLSNVGHGIFIYGGKRNDVSSNQVRNNNQDGIVYQNTAESIINSNTTHMNGQGEAGTYSGIVCDGCANITISNNVSLDTDFPPMHQAYGLQISGVSNNITVSSNILAPNLDGAASLVEGAVVSARGNVGLADR